MSVTAYIRSANDPVFRVECYMNRAGEPDGRPPFPVLNINSDFSLYASIYQLAEVRDTITRFLESEGYNRPSALAPAGLADSPTTSKQQEPKPSAGGVA